jgi:hypothetical protein
MKKLTVYFAFLFMLISPWVLSQSSEAPREGKMVALKAAKLLDVKSAN